MQRKWLNSDSNKNLFCVNINKSVQAYIDCAYKQKMITNAEMKKNNFQEAMTG